jgi:hypothetical protein
MYVRFRPENACNSLYQAFWLGGRVGVGAVIMGGRKLNVLLRKRRILDMTSIAIQHGTMG